MYISMYVNDSVMCYRRDPGFHDAVPALPCTSDAFRAVVQPYEALPLATQSSNQKQKGAASSATLVRFQWKSC